MPAAEEKEDEDEGCGKKARRTREKRSAAFLPEDNELLLLNGRARAGGLAQRQARAGGPAPG